ncbi:hypothetical protein NW762_009193 [Fusarium torreyae]|uniref:Major facilitator superfamily (MFS) profile domain-containing protein n=1 Tax=Fusarium torreyae TaxID=1237075 RepID=A0A9W8VC10_9HYPO|nr:hypothetical protein NW762_009193 [Fusarium torreyae]
MGATSSPSLSPGNEVYKRYKNNTNEKWTQDPGLKKLNMGIAFMFSSAASNGSDNIGDVSPSILGLIIAGISLGGLPAFIPAAYVSDWMGRRFTIALGSSIMVAASIIQALTKGPWAFLGTKIMLGIGLGFAQTSAPPLTTEIAHPRHRANVTNLFQAIWFWGAILSAVVTIGTLHMSGSWSWRIPVLFQAFFPAMQLIGLTFIPESPRWLISKGRREEAFDILVKYHANGDTSDELVNFEFKEICTVIDQEREMEKTTGIMSFFKTKGNRHRLLICVLVGFMIQWAGNGIVSYYLAPILTSVGVTNAVSQAGINLGLQVWNAILAACGAMAAERYGRRPLWFLSTSGMLCAFIVVTALSAVFAEHGTRAAGYAVVAFLFIFFGFYDIAFTPLSIAYPVEILPYDLRSKGLSINLSVVFGAGFFNQYVNPIALDAIQWKFYFVYIATLAAMLPTIWFLFPETKGRTLEEIAVVFDGLDANPLHSQNASAGVFRKSVEVHSVAAEAEHV